MFISAIQLFTLYSVGFSRFIIVDETRQRCSIFRINFRGDDTELSSLRLMWTFSCDLDELIKRTCASNILQPLQQPQVVPDEKKMISWKYMYLTYLFRLRFRVFFVFLVLLRNTRFFFILKAFIYQLIFLFRLHN